MRRTGQRGRQLSAEKAATLIGNAFLGSEALILLGFDRHELPIRAALRRLGMVIRALEEGNRAEGVAHADTTS